jgi:GAF domain-containing protein/CheY-like chemotaxis protein
VGEDAVFFDNPDLPRTRSEMALPLEVRGRVMGVLDVQSEEAAAFSDEDVAVLQTLADQVALAIENARLLEESQQALRELEIAYGEYVRTAWQGLEGLPAFEYDRVEVRPTEPEPDPFIDKALSAGDVVAVTDPEDGRSALVAPLRLRDQIIGAFALEETDAARPWTEEEIELVEAVTEQVALALENARLFEETRQRSEELSALNRIASATSRSLELEGVLREALAQVLSITGFEAGLISLVRPATGQMYLAVHRGLPEPLVRRLLEVGMEGTLCDLVYQLGEVMVVEDMAQTAPIDVGGLVKMGLRSYLGVPLESRGRVLGTLCAFGYTPRSIPPATHSLMQAVGQQVGVAVENARLFEATRIHAEELAVLNELGQALTTRLDVEEVLEETYRGVSRLLDTTNFYIALYDPESESVSFPLSVEEGRRVQWRPRRMGQGLTEHIIHNRRPVLIKEDLPERLTEMGIEMIGRTALSWMGVPLMIGDRVLGVLAIQSYTTPHAYDEHDLDLLIAIASQTAIALQNAHLFEETERRATQLAAAAEVARDATAILDVDQLLNETVHLISEQFGFYHAGVFLMDERGEYAVLRAVSSEGGRRMLERGHRLKVGEVGIVGYVASTGESRIALDVGEDAVHFVNPDLPDTRSEIALPLISRGRIIGVLDVQSTEPTAFTEEDEAVLRTMADQLATAIENARLFSETEQALAETRELFEASQAIGGATTSSEVGQALVDYVSRTGFDVARLLFFEFEQDEPVGVVLAEDWTVDGRPHYDAGARFPVTEFALSRLMDPDEVVTVEDIYAAPRLDEETLLAVEIARLRSFAVIPLTVGRRQIGGLLVGRRVPYKYPEKLIRNLWTLCGQAAIAIENLRLLEETRRRAQQLEAINEVGRAITSVLDLEAVLRQIVDTTKERFGHYFVSILLMEGERLVFEDGSTIGDSDRRLARRSKAFDLQGPGIVSDAARTGRPVLVNDVRDDPRYAPVPEIPNTLSELAVPIEVKGRVIGVLDVESDHPFAYDQTDVVLLQSLASQAGVAIENARLFAETEAEARRRALISEVLQAASTSLDPEDLLHQAGETISRRLGTPSAVFLWVPEEGALRPVAVHAADATDVPLDEGMRVTCEMNPVLFAAVEQRRSQVLERVAGHVSGPFAVLADRLRLRSDIYVPLISRERVLGVLALCRVEGQPPPSPDDVSFAEIIGANLSVVLENARLFQDAVRTAERLAEVDRLKSQFLANMSHELRTPLNSIIGFSRVILKGIDGPLTDLQRQDLEAIYNSGQHLLGLINDILDISKIEAGKMELAFEMVDLEEVVRGVMATAVALVKDKPVELQQSIPADLPAVIGDNRRIRQVLLNLVSNAAKFTDEGFIRVEVWADEEFVTVSVADSGIGIPPDKLPHIFEAFTQVDASPARKYGGTGLGLTISKSFVELHGGRIWAESEVGQGSTFYFTLPVQGPPALREGVMVKEPPVPVEMPEEEGGKLVLCVDDDQGVITLFRRYLHKQGYRVVGLTDATRVLEEARRLKPHAITLDVMMPEKDGWQVIQELKADPETCHIPVVMCTIVSEEGRGMSLGAADYLVKPILEQDLLAALDRLDREAGRHLVLVVDDQERDRKLLRRMIETQDGYEVVEASSGQEAIRLIQRVRPQLIVLDLMMPEVDGFAVLEAVKADEATRSIPIIVVTAKELTEEERRLLNHRIAALIQKGVLEQEELLEDVVAALEKLGRRQVA